MKKKVDLYNDRPRAITVDGCTFPAVIFFADIINPAGSVFSSLRPEPECVSNILNANVQNLVSFCYCTTLLVTVFIYILIRHFYFYFFTF